jgi:hypothetical protein
MKQEAQLLANIIKTPDGTILQSFHRHDCKQHVDALTGETYRTDGGLYYICRSTNIVPAKCLDVYTDDPHALIRHYFCWGTRGKDGRQPLTYKPLKDLDTEHIEAILETRHHVPGYIREVFRDELNYRVLAQC